jgi:hypothetical protein
MRRATLCGWENLNKRFKLAAAFYNLSQLMRKLFGFGTPKQLEALSGALFSLLRTLFLFSAAIIDGAMVQWPSRLSMSRGSWLLQTGLGDSKILGSSTGC